ncbi:hypothetical protein SAMN05444487_10787 [Marininema mesophilum]|uniref:Uncharacterized protein n=1 Tax=Marininema mesophilum TaxID=1048340 RepID=A0A1H2X5B9_9BACL|nr:hypothetical protein [Marininema mesophilum]SDW87978.1 hypothetical protein SAMN05444487_10787 [Marininema mesophilum]
MGNNKLQWWKRGATTVEYVALLFGIALLAFILNYFVSNGGQSQIHQKIVSIINGDIKGTDINGKDINGNNMNGNQDPGKKLKDGWDKINAEHGLLITALKKAAGAYGKSKFFYENLHKRLGVRLIPVYDADGVKTGYRYAGDGPTSFKDKKLFGRYFKNGTEFGLKNQFNSFGKGAGFALKGAGGWLISSGMALYSAYGEFQEKGLTTDVGAEFINELGWGVGAGVVSAGAGAALAGVLAGTAAGATIGSSVPLVGTVIGAVIGAGIGVALSTEVGQTIKNKTKEGIKWGLDKAKEGIGKGVDTVKSWFS